MNDLKKNIKWTMFYRHEFRQNLQLNEHQEKCGDYNTQD